MNLANYDTYTITEMESDYICFIQTLSDFDFELNNFRIMKDALYREVIDASEFCTLLNFNMFPDWYTENGDYIEKYEDGTQTIIKTGYTPYDIMEKIFG